ncbi:hypothetical protein JXL21_11700, partial [Candidatus Bathyarchaeota archaeon]|nr:hypothetical protein [Candidatus Bathyarchaeota archaeon]
MTSSTRLLKRPNILGLISKYLNLDAAVSSVPSLSRPCLALYFLGIRASTGAMLKGLWGSVWYQ